MATILVLHGPNLNLLGEREPQHYGRATLEEINEALVATATEHGHVAECFQSNAEHALVERIQVAMADTAFIIINPAAFTHTSVAIRDALAAVGIPFIEVHLSNVFSREDFRQRSYLTDIAKGVISGLGAQGYEFALQAAIQHLEAGEG